ncbi:MAG: hypothetical protein NUW09_03380 [Deltaproteobacteria bacterium]|nr:hypothetical protein [Deltaproteobacteria bacterium]
MPWAIVAASVISGMMANWGREDATYTPNATWVKMREDLMRNVQTGLDAGGYTWDDATNATLKRLGVESAATPYKGAQERVMSGMAPYGNVGAMGRALTGLNTARAESETTAARNVDMAREQAKQTSYGQMLNMAGSIGDPNLPQAGISMLNSQKPSTMQILGTGLATGIGTSMNITQAEKNAAFWDKFLTAQSGGTNPLMSSSSNKWGGSSYDDPWTRKGGL